MRPTFIAIAAGLVSALGTIAFAAPSAPASGTAVEGPAPGPKWCGFEDKAGSQVRCGYASESDCKRAVGGPDAICIVDPYFTERRRARAEG
jgi:hypothetical protein